LKGTHLAKIYEYFLGKFAMVEGQKGGEFFTPTSIVKLIVEIIRGVQPDRDFEFVVGPAREGESGSHLGVAVLISFAATRAAEPIMVLGAVGIQGDGALQARNRAIEVAHFEVATAEPIINKERDLSGFVRPQPEAPRQPGGTGLRRRVSECSAGANQAPLARPGLGVP
jgi:hypothetical protein